MLIKCKKIKKNWINPIIFLFYLSIPFIMYFRYLINRQVPVSGDALGFYRLRELAKIMLGEGEFPLWNKYLTNGIPYVADLNGVFSPISWICMFFPLKIQTYLFYAIHIALGSFFMYLYLQEINIRRIVAFSLGILYATSVYINGYRKSHIMIIAVIVYLPIVLYYIQKYINTLEIKYLIFSSLALAVSFLEGFPQDQLYIDVVAFFYLSVFLFIKKRNVISVIKDVFFWGISFVGLIMVQLLPTLELMKTYNSNGAGSMTYGEFAVYSLNPVKILIMLFPRMFMGDYIASLNAYNSSEMDIEIYLGVFVVLFAIFAVLNQNQNKYLRFATVGCILSFLYACSAKIHLLGKIIYHLPLFGSFRCTSRILFIFQFFVFVIYAITIDSLSEKICFKKFCNFTQKVIAFSICSLILIAPVFFLYSTSNEEMIWTLKVIERDYFQYFVSLVELGILLYIIRLLYNKKIGNPQVIYRIGVILCTVLIVVDVLPFSLDTSASDFREIYNESEKEYYEAIKKQLGNGKVIVANSNIDGGYKSLFSSELGMHYGIPVINSYISLNNPKIYKLMSPYGMIGAKQNFSGLYTGFENISYDIIYRNDILSMMGVKYVIDPQNIVPQDGKIVTQIEKEKTILDEKNISLSCDDNLCVFSRNVQLKSNEVYVVELNINNEGDEAVHAYCDFYGGEAYDLPEQQREFILKTGNNGLKMYVLSGQIPEGEDIQFRIVVPEPCNLQMEDITLSLGKGNKEEAYKILIDDENERIVENLKAKDVLYIPESVQGISSFEVLYENQDLQRLDETSYIIGNEAFQASPAVISDIVWKNNSITANVMSEGMSFINFSNNYLPGWTAYIDGKRTKIYEVNGLIQGIKIENGTHKIKMVYRPISLYIGIFLTMGTLLGEIIFLLKKREEITDENNRQKQK